MTLQLSSGCPASPIHEYGALIIRGIVVDAIDKASKKYQIIEKITRKKYWLWR
jgi:hypothetical protein